MGWNEILGTNVHEYQADKGAAAELELSKSSVVHFWKADIKPMTEAPENGYTIVDSLHTETYLDYSYDNISLKRSYDFDPIPKDLSPEYHNRIVGIGCQMWGRMDSCQWVYGFHDFYDFSKDCRLCRSGMYTTSTKRF